MVCHALHKVSLPEKLYFMLTEFLLYQHFGGYTFAKGEPVPHTDTAAGAQEAFTVGMGPFPIHLGTGLEQGRRREHQKFTLTAGRLLAKKAGRNITLV